MKRSRFILIVLMLLAINVISPVYAQDDDTFVIGNLILVGDEGFRAEMTELGYVEGENVTYLYISYENYVPEEWQAEYEKQVKAMVDAGVDIFVANSDSDAVALKALVGDIPIVFARADDPVATGAVESLVSPGGNLTGIITNKPHERRLEVLTEIKPETKKVYYLYSAMTLEAGVVLEQVQTLAEELDVEIIPAPITTPEDYMKIVQNMPEDVDWVFLTPFVYFDEATFDALLAITEPRHIGITYIVDMPMPGYVMGYGPNLDDTGRQAARIIDRILRGASPADLPVETADNFLMINLEAAAASGIEIPESILRQANTIIRPGYFEALATPSS